MNFITIYFSIIFAGTYTSPICNLTATKIDSIQQSEDRSSCLTQSVVFCASNIPPMFTLIDTNSYWSLTIASVYGYSWLLRKSLRKFSDKIPLPLGLKFAIWGEGSGMLLESFAIMDNFRLPDSEKILLHPDTKTDLYLASGFYAPFVCTWSFLANKYDYTPRDIFIISGLSGIVIEQSGAIFKSFNPVAWGYVFLVYGSYQALPGLLVENQLKQKQRIKLSWQKKYLYGFGGQAVSFVLAGATIYALAKFGNVQFEK
ncbi:MAG: hypothetical protein ABIL70_07765 [candidate division WOR-3 bacterium]